MMARSPDILNISEYIKNVLYFAVVKQGKSLKSTGDVHYFTVDNELVYENYYNDFGPLNLGCVYRYSRILNDKLKEFLNKQSIVHYTFQDPKKKANAAYLLGCYGVLYLSLSPREAMRPLVMYGQTYRPFQDATQGDSCYTISLLDCLQGIKKAKELGFFNFHDFDFKEYERLDKIQGGDLNWIVPGKFLAFIGPVDYNVSIYHPPEMYINYFKENNVNVVIRLNKKQYDSNIFTIAGITHHDLFFPDGACPPRHILFRFLEICEECCGAVGVHCKAGLGRTGTLIGSYLIKHYRMTAREAISWMRICRPGSVIGHQQAWLEQLEPWLMKQGNLYRKHKYYDSECIPKHEYGVYSIAERSLKCRPTFLTKSISPPPPIHRQTRSDVVPKVRPQASKFREASNKTTTKEQSNLRVSSPRVYRNDKNKCKPASGEIFDAQVKRAVGAGDPRTLGKSKTPISSRESTPKYQSRLSASPKPSYIQNDIIIKNGGEFHKVPSFRSPIITPIKTVNQAKNILTSSTFSQKRSSEKEKQLNSVITITPQKHYKIDNFVENKPSQFASNYGSGSREQINCSIRRRLGRSPSPPQVRGVFEQSRATNTPTSSKGILTKDASMTALTEVLSRLKVSKPREKSIGAASLGARRDAPVDPRATSVRSDDRPLATQGDMLNSIKFQRRFKEILQSNKFSAIPREPPKHNICRQYSRMNIGTQQVLGKETPCNLSKNWPGESKERRKFPTPQGFLNNVPRPTSPKGRNRNVPTN